jgi:hypothetical protein
VFEFLAAEGSPDAPAYITQILQWGPPGVVVVLILTGVLITKGQFDAMKKDRDDWKAAYEKEVEGHEDTRGALSDAVKAAASSLEVARTTTALLTNLGHIAQQGNKGSS